MTNEAYQRIDIESFNYHLPEHQIAQKPTAERTQCKLLVYQNGRIIDSGFNEINQFLPNQTTLVFNNTRVIPARLYFKRPSGALIQVFMLHPVAPFNNMEQSLDNQNGAGIWECMVGQAKKWKDAEVLSQSLYIDGKQVEISVELIQRNPFHVSFKWTEGIAFSRVIEGIGNMPLPPYIKRNAEVEDLEQYQTVFAKHKGAVAAPTAGLHFSDDLISDLKKAGHQTTELTLHVGAGTFKPVETNLVWNHPMHEEAFVITQQTLLDLQSASSIIATGTTSLRTLESLFWCAVNIRNGVQNPMFVAQHQPYLDKDLGLSFGDALEILDAHLNRLNQDKLIGQSGLMIMPGYKIRSVSGLITNFHLPKSTLLLLIAALVGEDWKNIYNHALSNNYRFLSYGDSSLLMKS